MHHKLILGVAALSLSLACGQNEDHKMSSPLLEITAKCRANDQCLFDGHDMFVDLAIANTQDVEVGFPLEFVQASGPIVKLTDTRTRAETYLKPNLADPEKQKNIVWIPPGRSVPVEWVLTAGELERFGDLAVDVSAEFTIMARVHVRDRQLDFRGAATLRIVGRKR